LFPYLRVFFFISSVVLVYVFWEWGGAEFLVEGVKPHSSVEVRAVGKPAPELKVPAKEIWSKQDFSLSSLRGHPVLLHFWATWCAPCLKELPELLALTKKIRAEGYSVVTVAVDDSWSKLEIFFARYPELSSLKDQTILVLDPNGKIAEKFGSSRFPESFLINDQGVIDNKLVGMQPWNDPQMMPYLRRLRAAENAR
jgi:cytochrome c biogenesis protein CcmG, thiol:disulfide interchange protein DsbE